MKFSLTSLIFTLFLFYGYAQSFQLSEAFPDQIYLYPHTNLTLKDGSFLGIKTKNAYSERRNASITLNHLDKEMKLIHSNKLNLEEKGQFLEKILYLRDTVFCLVGSIDDIYGTSSLSAHILNLEALEIGEKIYSIYEFKSHVISAKHKLDKARRIGRLTQRHVSSPSREYFAFINYDKLLHKREGLVSFKILNDHFELIEEGLIDLEPGKNYSNITDIQYFLTDQAELMLYFKAKEPINKENSSLLIKLSGSQRGTLPKQKLRIADGELHSVQFFPSQTDDQFFVLGLYTSGANKFEGVARFKIEPQGFKKTKTTLAAFPKDLIPSKNRRYNYAKAYELLKVIPLEGNNCMLVAEHYKKVSNTYRKPSQNYGGQLIIGYLNQGGKFSWIQTVEKLQRSLRLTHLGTIVLWDQSHQKAHLLFNYNESKTYESYVFDYYDTESSIKHLSIDVDGKVKNYPSVKGYRLMNYGHKYAAYNPKYVNLIDDKEEPLFSKVTLHSK